MNRMDNSKTGKYPVKPSESAKNAPQPIKTGGTSHDVQIPMKTGQTGSISPAEWFKTAEDLRQTTLFQEIDDNIVNQIAQRLQLRLYQKGEIIIARGDEAKSVYIVRSGNVELFSRHGEANIFWSYLGKYAIFGEVEVMLHTNHLCSARAVCDTELYYIPQKTFLSLIQRVPELGISTTRQIARQLKEQWIEKRFACISLAEMAHESDLIQLLPMDIIRKHQMVPITQGKTHLTVAMVNPYDWEGITALAKALNGRAIVPVVIRQADFQAFAEGKGVPISKTPGSTSKELLAKKYTGYELYAVDQSGGQTMFPFTSERMTVGRQPDNDIVLPDDSRLSDHHALFEIIDDKVYVQDINSQHGVVINSLRIAEKTLVPPGMNVTIGEHRFFLMVQDVSFIQDFPVQSGGETNEADEHQQSMDRIIKSFFGPIVDYFDDPDVSEIMINHWDDIYIERHGKLEKTEKRFQEESYLDMALKNIARFVGRRIDQENPRLDARLPDGSRVHAVLPPCARRGMTMTIRKFPKERLTMSDLITKRSIPKDAARFLEFCVEARRNIVVSGGTGSGKTSLLNILSAHIPEGQRIVVVEDASELQLQQDHVVMLETKPADKNGRGEVNIRDLLHSCLRLRPDRIVVGEVRGNEAIDMLQAMNTGHGGSMTTVHSNGPRDALARIETMCLMSSVDLPLRAIRDQIAAAIHMIFHIERLMDGSRKLTHVSEVLGLDDQGNFQLQDIYVLKAKRLENEPMPIFKLIPTGKIPFCYQHAINRGVRPLPDGFFEPKKKKVASPAASSDVRK